MVVDNEDGYRTVHSSYGEVVAPEDPQRVVSVIGDVDLDAMLVLYVPVVGAGTSGGTSADGFASHLADGLEGVTPLAWTDGVPYEAIAALDPDLAFVPDQEAYDTLSAIAPTVARGSWSGPGWTEDFRYVAAVLGREEEAEELVAAHEARAAETSTVLADRVGADVTVVASHGGRGHGRRGVAVVRAAAGTRCGHPLLAGAPTGRRHPRPGGTRPGDRGAPVVPVAAVGSGRVVKVVNRPWHFPASPPPALSWTTSSVRC